MGAAGRGSAGRLYDDDIVPPVMRKGIAVYEAARALMGLITPHYDEISKARPRTWLGRKQLLWTALNPSQAAHDLGSCMSAAALS